MGWLVGVIVVAVIIFFYVRSRKQADGTPGTTDAPATGSSPPRYGDLPPEGLRSAALQAYDKGSALAKDAGKDGGFCHQLGVLEAVSIITGGAVQDDKITRALQMETLPFNQMPPAIGRIAVAEYLVWKPFPQSANLEVLREPLENFRSMVYADAEEEEDPSSFTYAMLYSGQYGWQELAILLHKTDEPQ